MLSNNFYKAFLLEINKYKIILFYTMNRNGMHFVFKMKIKENKHRVFSIFLGRKTKYQGIRVYISKACFATGFFLLITF